MKFLEFLKLIRAVHWIKNLFIFVPLVFSGHLFQKDYFSLSLIAFFSFSFLTSVVYVINDIFDVENDRKHPKKKFRPIAAGLISKQTALIVALLMLIAASSLAGTLNFRFIFVSIVYLILNVAYTFYFKNVVLLDIFSIAGGFVLRVAAGTVVISVEPSSWLILISLFISLFLAVMKRMSELEVVASTGSQGTRKVLQNYSARFIDQISAVCATGVIICYTLYSVSERTVEILQTENLVYTTPFVVFGIFRYMYLVYHKHQGENTIEILLTDLPTIVNSTLYLLMTIVVVYNVFYVNNIW